MCVSMRSTRAQSVPKARGCASAASSRACSAAPFAALLAPSAVLLLASPVDTHGILVLPEAHLEIAFISAGDCLADAARRMHIASRDHRLLRCLDDMHDPVQRMLGPFLLRGMTRELQQLGAVGVEERSREIDVAGRKIV